MNRIDVIKQTFLLKSQNYYKIKIMRFKLVDKSQNYNKMSTIREVKNVIMRNRNYDKNIIMR